MADKLSPFDFVTAVSQTKRDLLDEDPSLVKDYNPFLVNRALSYFPETVLHANEMNTYADLPKDQQFYYYFHAVRSARRFSKWGKKRENGDIQLVMDYFGYSQSKAQDAVSCLTKEQIEEIREIVNRGRDQ